MLQNETRDRAVAEMGDDLATIHMGITRELLYPFPWGSWVPI